MEDVDAEVRHGVRELGSRQKQLICYLLYTRSRTNTHMTRTTYIGVRSV